MFLSFLWGVVLSKLVNKQHIFLLAAIISGILIGFLGAFGVFGVVYPFFISQFGLVTEFVYFGLFFMIPQIRIYSFQSEWLSNTIPLAPIVVITLIATSIVSVLAGQVVGHSTLSSKARWRPLAITGVILLFLAGFNTTVPTWLNYLSFGFFVSGIIILILAALEFRKRDKV